MCYHRLLPKQQSKLIGIVGVTIDASDANYSLQLHNHEASECMLTHGQRMVIKR
jgi:hypothetical protein